MEAKKAAKKAAKKVAGKHDLHKAAKDARRTFEHLGRVQALASLSSAEASHLAVLTRLSDTAFQAQRYKDSADLLRAAEHLSFAAIYANEKETVASDLKDTISTEVAHLLERMEEHAADHTASGDLLQLRERFSGDAKKALQRGSYRAALELARGAEALAHVHEPDKKALPSSAPQGRLRS